MKKNLLILSFIVAGLLILPAFVFAYSSSFSPSGLIRENPQNVQVNFENFDELKSFCYIGVEWASGWMIYFNDVEYNGTFGEGYSFSELSADENFYLPIGDYVEIAWGVWENTPSDGVFCAEIDWDEGEIIFSVPSGEGPVVLFTLPNEAITSTTAYIGDLFHDAGLLIFLFIALPLGFYIIKKWLDFMPK